MCAIAGVVIVLVPFWGYNCMMDTVLPFVVKTWDICFFLFGVAVVVFLVVCGRAISKGKTTVRKAFRATPVIFPIHLFCCYFVVGILSLVVLGSNKYFGGKEHEYINSTVGDVKRGVKGARYAEIYVERFDRVLKRSVNSFRTGDSCVVECHEGMFGLYVIDGVQHR